MLRAQRMTAGSRRLAYQSDTDRSGATLWRQKTGKDLPVGVFAAAPTPVSATKTMSETLLGAIPVAMLLCARTE